MQQKKKKILLVEDDELLRKTIFLILNRKYEVVEAKNGQEARNVIPSGTFDLILSDIQMPHVSGVDLLEWTKKNHPTKFILMTGFSHIIETHKAQDLGADDFLAKPFSNEELSSIIDLILTPEKTSIAVLETKVLDSDYCKVPIDDFVSEKAFEFEIFLRLNATKYLKIGHKGGKIPKDRVDVYKAKGVDFLYISKNDFGKLVGFTLHLSKAVTSSSKLDQDKKDRFVRYTGEMIVQNTFVNGLDEASYNNAKDFAQMSISTISEDSQMLNMLSNFNEHADFLYVHSIAVSTFSVMIAKELGLTRPATIFNLSMAGLFHDIGKKEIPREILLKSRAELSQKERQLLETHPSRGKEILESLKNIPSDVVAVCYEHHENLLELGYPRRIPRLKIHPMAHIVSVAKIFANYTVKNPAFPDPVSAREALMLMDSVHKELIDPQSFEALNAIVKSKK